MPNMSTQVLGSFKTGMDRSSKRGGKDGAQRLYTLQNAYLNERGEAIPRPGLAHVADVGNSAGLYGWKGQLHVFHGEDDFVDPGNPLVVGHWVRYPLAEMSLQLTGALGNLGLGDTVDYSYVITGAVGPYVVSISEGALPTGLSMSASGEVTGTTTAEGAFSWTVSVSDSDQRTITLPDSCTVAETIGHAILADTPILYWPLNETSGTVVNDLSGNGYNGAITGTVTQSSSGLTLPAKTAYVLFPGSVSGSPTDVGTLTHWAMEIVATRTGTGGSSGEVLLTQWISPNFGIYNAGLLLLGQKPSGGSSQVAAADSPNLFTNGVRKHLFIVRDGTLLTIYENGAAVNSYSPMNLVSDPSNGFGLAIGGYAFPNSYGFIGKVEHAAVYPHAVTAARVLHHAQLLGLA